VGINTGPAVVGNLGSTLRFDYTMLGDTVNLGARLEGVNKQFGTYTMISEMTKEAIEADSGSPTGSPPTPPTPTPPILPMSSEAGDNQPLAFRELGRITVVGRAEPVTVYEPMFETDYARRRADLEVFSAALGAYYAGAFREAERGFAALAERDSPAAAYAERCRHLAAEPPEDWNGVWIMTSK